MMLDDPAAHRLGPAPGRRLRLLLDHALEHGCRTKVTPAALIACRSQGASSSGRAGERFTSVFSSISSTRPTRRGGALRT